MSFLSNSQSDHQSNFRSQSSQPPLAAVEAQAPFLKLTWADGLSADYLYLWLRDNCPSGFHPQTKERTFDLLSVSDDLAPLASWLEDGDLVIDWREGGHRSRFAGAWLRAHRPGTSRPDPASPSPRLWDRESLGQIPQADAFLLCDSDAALLDWMRSFADSGLALVTGLGDDPAFSRAVGERVGFLRRTNFGLDFSVESKADPNNLAYTALALQLHTDLSNQELPPGYQFLHCQTNQAEGGGSLFADGYKIIEDLRQQHPQAFKVLSETAISARFHDQDCDLHIHRPVIGLDSRGQVKDLRFNAHLVDVLDLPSAQMALFYPAYRELMRRVRAQAYRVELMLHGRAAFDPGTGRRRLSGFYVDRGEFDSRLRTLARQP